MDNLKAPQVICIGEALLDRLGPLGGEKGGHIVYQGLPENIVKYQKSFTGKYLKRYI